MKYATLGSGCFWCTEAVFQRLKGVKEVKVGYTGGNTKKPTYKEVCSGMTGHAEVARISYDPDVISFEELLEVFWKTHDPTTLNRQGNDVGTQYRSAIFYHDEEQKNIAKKYIKQLNETNTWPNPIVTEVVPLTEFYEAEDYHDNYFNDNQSQPYCSFVIAPKIAKFEKEFSDKLNQ